MRTIKFRGKRVDNEKWVYGDLVNYSKIDPFTYITIGIGYKINNPEIGSAIKVYPDSIGQFIGLTDKNKKEIFSGDILRTDNQDIVEVIYESIYASFGIWKKGWAFLSFFHEAVEPENCEVIGNIHENADLLK